MTEMLTTDTTRQWQGPLTLRGAAYHEQMGGEVETRSEADELAQATDKAMSAAMTRVLVEIITEESL